MTLTTAGSAIHWAAPSSAAIPLPPPDRYLVARLVALTQAFLLSMAGVIAAVAFALGGGPPTSAVLTAVVAVLLVRHAAALRIGQVPRTLRPVQWVLVATGVVDLVLYLVLRTWPLPTSLMTSLVGPAVVLRSTRRPRRASGGS